MIWLIFAVTIIAGILIHLWHFIKSLRDKGYKNKKSRYGAYCLGNHGGITEEEKEELLEYLEKL